MSPAASLEELTPVHKLGADDATDSFNCGQDDNYGFEKGAAALHDELGKEHVKHEYHLYPGDHSITYFLSHFEEVMEFHSRAFGLVPSK